MDLTVSIQSLAFSLTLPTIFGNNVNHLLNVFGPLQSGLSLVDETGIFYLGEQYTMGGQTFEMVGSGFAQPGIALGPLIIPTGFPVDVMIMRNMGTGQYYFVYPNGTPNILSAVALVTNTSAKPYSASFAGAPPVCFATGTMIATRAGLKPVEQVLPGDLLYTVDGSLRRVLWTGGRTIPRLPVDQRPVVIRAEALGRGLPYRTLRLSPNHRIALRRGAEVVFGPVKALVDLPRVRAQKRDLPVGYHTLLLDRHAAILAEGLGVESLLLGDQAREALGELALAGIAGRLGCRIEDLPTRPEALPAGRLLSAGETRALIRETVMKMASQDTREAIGIGALQRPAISRAKAR